MAWDAILTPEIGVGKPVSLALMTKIKDNLDYLYGEIGTETNRQVPNSSFEIDSDDDGEPDGWDITLYTGGSFEIMDAADESAADPAHGKRCIKFTHPGGSGNGGGYVDSDYVECGPGNPWNVSWYQRNSVAGCHVLIVALWYDEDKVTLGADTTLLNSTSNPTDWTKYTRALTVPAGARYLKIRLVGGYDATDTAGEVEFDLVTLNDSYFELQVFTGNTTWTRSGGRYVLVEVVGGGGGGGEGYTGAIAGNGGGAGGRAIEMIDVSEVATVSVTVGGGGNGGGNSSGEDGDTGGTSSFGTHCSATGGGGGDGGGGSINPGNSGGAGSGGDINAYGEYSDGGVGGSSPYGSGGLRYGAGTAGMNATGRGAGGGGGGAGDIGVHPDGGDGSGGLVAVWEFS